MRLVLFFFPKKEKKLKTNLFEKERKNESVCRKGEGVG